MYNPGVFQHRNIAKNAPVYKTRTAPDMDHVPSPRSHGVNRADQSRPSPAKEPAKANSLPSWVAVIVGKVNMQMQLMHLAAAVERKRIAVIDRNQRMKR